MCRMCNLPKASTNKVIAEMFLAIIARNYSKVESERVRYLLSVRVWREP
jgi:hypothetical protein